jgi:hypothetical protein
MFLMLIPIIKSKDLTEPDHHWPYCVIASRLSVGVAILYLLLLPPFLKEGIEGDFYSPDYRTICYMPLIIFASGGMSLMYSP